MRDMQKIINALPQGAVLHGKSYSYTIQEVLGQGSFGITYLAKVTMQGELGSIDCGAKVAVKEFFMREINGREECTVTSASKGGLFADYRKKFAREAQNLGALQHPNIIKVLESFEENNTIYYTMEYIDGGSLDSYIGKVGTVGEEETLKVTRQIGSALSCMHRNRMLHLDLKPANIMRRHDGTPVLIDFGLSKLYDGNGEPESSTTVGKGTPGYAPIEQANYQDGHGFPVTMDVYALGATMFKMLTGKRPPEATEILNEGFPVETLLDLGISEDVVASVETAMQPMRKKRYQSVDDFMEGLGSGNTSDDTIVEVSVNPKSEETQVESHPHPQPEPSPNPKPSKVKRYVIAAVVAVAVAVCGIVWYIYDYSNSHEWVDLGLSVKWATCNVGAKNPGDYGGYYAWGETCTKSDYDESSYFDCDFLGSLGGFGTYKRDGQRGISVFSRHDTARENWGGTWRMPTDAEFEELCTKCKWTWTTKDGHNGYVVTGPNGNSIFLPAAGWRFGTYSRDVGEYGYYWSSTLSSSNSDGARSLCFGSGNHYTGARNRCHGRSARPVTE